MPIECDIAFKRISQQEFKEIDFLVMGAAFDVQNELGNLCDESVYQNTLAKKCRELGLSIETEVPVKVSHGDFEKTYRLDFCVNECVVYELKTVDQVLERHRAQAIQYLHFTGLSFGKIINFKSPSVEGEFVSTSVSSNDRFEYSVVDQGWKDCGTSLQKVFLEIVEDWGLFLSTELYTEGTGSLLIPPATFDAPVELQVGGLGVGRQHCDLISGDSCFQITSVKKSVNRYEANTQKWLNHTPLRCFQWININNHQIQFKTLSNHYSAT